MSKYPNLFAEVYALQDSWGYQILDAITYIDTHQEDYQGPVYTELKQFMAEARRFFAEV